MPFKPELNERKLYEIKKETLEQERFAKKALMLEKDEYKILKKTYIKNEFQRKGSSMLKTNMFYTKR